MIKLLILLSLIAITTLGVNWINKNPGEVEFIWLGYQVETSVSALFVGFLLIILILIILYKILSPIVFLPFNIKKGAQRRKLEKSLDHIGESYAALLSGDLDNATKSIKRLEKLEKNLNNSGISRITKIIHAKILQEEGNLLLANHNFNELLEDKKNEYFATKGLLDSAFKSGDIEKSIELAEKAYKLRPTVKDGAHSLLELYKKAEKWEKAEIFLKRYKSKHLLSQDKNNNIDVNKELALIWYNQAIELSPSPETTNNINIQAHKIISKAIKNLPNNLDIILLYINISQLIGKHSSIKDKVLHFWKNNQSDKLAEVYLNSIEAKNEKALKKLKLKAISSLRKIHDSDYLCEVEKNINELGELKSSKDINRQKIPE